MKLYLARHGDTLLAESDAKRSLSTIGRQDIERLSQFLVKLGIEIPCVFHSGKLRAEQTANILSSAFGNANRVQARKGLEPFDAVIPLVQDINRLEEDTLFVGHLPFMANLTNALVTGNEYGDIVTFQPGTLVCLERSMNTHWIIQWVVPPALLHAIY